MTQESETDPARPLQTFRPGTLYRGDLGVVGKTAGERKAMQQAVMSEAIAGALRRQTGQADGGRGTETPCRGGRASPEPPEELAEASPSCCGIMPAPPGSGRVTSEGVSHRPGRQPQVTTGRAATFPLLLRTRPFLSMTELFYLQIMEIRQVTVP